jgi:hypothetical protein
MAIRPLSISEKRQYLKKDVKNIHNVFLSFEEICPQWSLALQLGYSGNLNLDIKDAKHCIVGEAHGFRNRGLRCPKCWEYSQSFTFCTYGNKMHKYIVTDNQRFEDLKFDFVSHFNQRHSFNRFHRLSIVDLSIRRDLRFLRWLKNLPISLFLRQNVIKGSKFNWTESEVSSSMKSVGFELNAS